MSHNLSKPDKLRASAGARPDQVHQPKPSTVEELLHELQTKQIELQKQNDELRRVQVELEKSRNHFVEIYDFAPVAYLTLNDKGLINEINLTGASLLGVERDNLLRKHLSRFISPEDRNNWLQYFTEALNSNDKLTRELSFVRQDTSNFHAHLESRRVLVDKDGPEVRLVLTDISKRKQAEFALRDQEVFFKMISENSDEFIAVLDLKGRRLYCSQSYAKLFGDVNSLIGKDSFADVHPEDRGYLQQIFKETVQTGNGMQASFRFVLPDGNIRYMESRGTLVKNINGVALRLVVVSRDITEKKLAAEEINSLALYDGLTGKSSRRLLHDRLEFVTTANKRRGNYAALLLIDLNGFKIFHELHEKETTDFMLVEASSRISSCVREADTVSRLEGDEFVVLLSELSADKDKSTQEAGIVAEKIHLALEEPYTLPKRLEGKADLNHKVTASIGVFLFSSKNRSADEIIKRADRAMFQTKKQDKNLICFFE